MPFSLAQTLTVESSKISKGPDIIEVTMTERGGDEIRRFRWDGKRIKFISAHTDQRLTDAIKDIFKKSASCSRKEYGNGLQDMTEEIALIGRKSRRL